MTNPIGGQPIVSVVTPFYNTAQYLPLCIESVLTQTWSNFEYLLVDNASTDGSGEIAESYAARDKRIRVVHWPALLPQVRNYNQALRQISASSNYCKIVQADDTIDAACLRSMVSAFEQAPTIGLVGSYYLKGDVVRGSGFPRGVTMLAGGEMARLYLRSIAGAAGSPTAAFGSPTAVMYRSSLILRPEPFFDEDLLHEDTEKCMQILREWDFGFVPQVLSFLRTDNESISSRARRYRAGTLDDYIIVHRYAREFLPDPEARSLIRRVTRDYESLLAQHALRLREREFWDYHRSGLRTVGQKLVWRRIARRLFVDALLAAANPLHTASNLLRFLQRRSRRFPKSVSASSGKRTS
jgi:glycosyltransferase involved in cell wall biosynthesis